MTEEEDTGSGTPSVSSNNTVNWTYCSFGHDVGTVSCESSMHYSSRNVIVCWIDFVRLVSQRFCALPASV